MTISFQPVDARGTTGAVIQRLVAVIRDGHLRVGDRLPSERELAAQLQVSRQTVRKAVHALVEAGVVEVRSGQGARSGAHVRSDVLPPELVGTPVALPNVGEVGSVLEARRMFEPRVAVLAGFLMTDADYHAMRAVIVAQEGAVDDLDQVRRLDSRFHMAIAHATHNPTVVALMQTLMERLDIARFVVPVDADEAHETLSIHARTLEAIASRDHRRIEQTMDEHLRQMEVAWERFTGRALPRSVPDFLLAPPQVG